ncbi:MAG: hypothetical protein CMJ83_16560 [Planctomycetes bacterium]|nr:hypothetical protein [Planctomycetota bacterium]
MLGGVLLSIIALAAPLPFRETGRFSLSAFALVDQLLVALLLASHILSTRPPAPPAWWPVEPLTALTVRGFGMVGGLAVAMGALVLLQIILAWGFGDLHAAVPLQEEPVNLAGSYLDLWIGLLLYGSILVAWSQTLRTFLGGALALLALLALVFTAFLLPRLAQEHAAIQPLVAMIPDLSNFAPVETLSGEGASGRHVMYLFAHLGAVWALGATALTIRHGRGANVEFGGQGP